MTELLKDVIHEKVETSYSLRSEIFDRVSEIELIDPENGAIQMDDSDAEEITEDLLKIITNFINQNYTLIPNKL